MIKGSRRSRRAAFAGRRRALWQGAATSAGPTSEGGNAGSLSARILKKLNEQIALEQASADVCLQMSLWCREHGLDGCASFLRLHSQAERTHMYRLSDYVNENGAKVVSGAPEPAVGTYASVRELFEEAYARERLATAKLVELLDVTHEEQDDATFEFLKQWATEQHEEEARLERIVAQLRCVGDDRRELFLVDQELAARQLPPKPDGDPA